MNKGRNGENAPTKRVNPGTIIRHRPAFQVWALNRRRKVEDEGGTRCWSPTRQGPHGAERWGLRRPHYCPESAAESIPEVLAPRLISSHPIPSPRALRRVASDPASWASVRPCESEQASDKPNRQRERERGAPSPGNDTRRRRPPQPFQPRAQVVRSFVSAARALFAFPSGGQRHHVPSCAHTSLIGCQELPGAWLFWRPYTSQRSGRWVEPTQTLPRSPESLAAAAAGLTGISAHGWRWRWRSSDTCCEL